MLTTRSLVLAALAVAAAVALALQTAGSAWRHEPPATVRPQFSRRMTTLPTVVVTTPGGTQAAAGTAAPVR